MKKYLYLLLVAAGFSVAIAASAQTTRGTSDINAQTGVSDRAQTQRPSGVTPESRENVKKSARQNANSMTNTNIPMGEATTRSKGQINPVPNNVSTTSRSDVRKEAMLAKPKDGQIFTPSK